MRQYKIFAIVNIIVYIYLSIHGCLGLEILGLDSELGFFCHLCWSCTELVFGICDF